MLCAGSNGNYAALTLGASGGFSVEQSYTNTINNSLSSSTVLNSGVSFTSSYVDTQGYRDVVIAVSASHDGNYSVTFSPDGINADSTLTRYYRTGFINPPHKFTLTRRYIKVTFTNSSSSNQTHFRLQTSLGSFEPLNVPIDGTVSKDYDAVVVRPTDPMLEMCIGRRQGHFLFGKFGYITTPGANTEYTVWPVGTNYVLQTAAGILSVVSSSVNDTNTGGSNTGARTIYVEGINANRKRQTETITMNGQNEVTTATTWLGINRVYVASSGSSQSNEGNITIRKTSTGGDVLAYVETGRSITRQAIYHAQLQSTLVVPWIYFNCRKISGGNSPRVTFNIKLFNPATNTITTQLTHFMDTSVTNDAEFKPLPYFFTTAPGTVVYATINSDNASTIAAVRFNVIEVIDANYDAET